MCSHCHEEEKKSPKHAHSKHAHKHTGCACGCEHCERGAAPIDLDHVDEEEEGGSSKIGRIIIAALFFIVALVMEKCFGIEGGTYLCVLVTAYLISGFDVLGEALDGISKGRVFDENFLMSVSSIAAFCVGEYPEAVAVMLLYQIGEYCQDLAVDKSRRSIANLMDVRPDRATVVKNGINHDVSAKTVEVGDIILVKPGEKVPLDGRVIDGASSLDTSALTGESLPRAITVGDDVLSGCVNQEQAIKIEVTRAFSESTATKIVEMVQNASARKAPAEQFITRFARYYTPVVVILAIFIAIAMPLITGAAWDVWVHRACTFLVISCPCALVISVPLTFFAGIGAASRSGILVKGGSYLEAMAKLDTVVFDKTGTLTRGVFEVTQVSAVKGDAQSERVLLESAAAAEVLSNHPIAKSILAEVQKRQIALPSAEACQAFTEIAGRGTRVTFEENTIYAGNAKLMIENGVNPSSLIIPENAAGSLVHVLRNAEYLGSIVISDTLKTDTASALTELKSLGVRKTVMLTGDHAQAANAVASNIAIDEVHAELLPGDKVAEFEKLAQEQGKIAFVGDGINDAPVLARADVGVAMGALGSDAAIEAADVVLMTDELSKLSQGVRIARKTHTIVVQNIVFALAVKAAFLVLGALGLINLWFAVFADVGVMLIAVANAMRAMKRS